MKELSKKQLKFLRKKSHSHKPLFQMGKLGLTEVFIEQIDKAIEKRELIKFNLLQNADEDLSEVAYEIAETIDAYVVQIIGSTAILYRPSSKEKYQKISIEVQDIN